MCITIAVVVRGCLVVWMCFLYTCHYMTLVMSPFIVATMHVHKNTHNEGKWSSLKLDGKDSWPMI